MTISKKDLENAVAELNDKICDPAISMKNEKKAKKKVIEAGKLIEKSDKISKPTLAVVKELTEKSDKKEKKKVKAEKPVKVKAKKEKKEKKEVKKGKQKQGIGAFIVENLQSGKFEELSNDKIIEKVLKKFPEANTKAANIPGYRKIANA